MLSCEICKKKLRTLFFTEQAFTVTASVYSESWENFNPEQLTKSGRCSSSIEKILAGEMNSRLKICTTLVVSLFEQICCFSKVFLTSIRSTEQLFLERPLYSCFLHNDYYPNSSNFCKKRFSGMLPTLQFSIFDISSVIEDFLFMSLR